MTLPGSRAWHAPERVPAMISERFGALLKAPLVIGLTVLFGTMSLVGSLLDSSGAVQHWCARKWGRALLVVARVRLTVCGLETLSRDVPYVLCANHQSDMDIPVLLAAVPFPFRFAAKTSLFRVPFLGWHLRRAGHISIDRSNPRAALKALTRSEHSVRNGLPVVVFPEGRISQDGRLADFKRGAFLLAQRTDASLVPVAIRGTRAVLGPSSWILKGGRVEVTLGPPLTSKDVESDELRSRVRKYIFQSICGELCSG